MIPQLTVVPPLKSEMMMPVRSEMMIPTMSEMMMPLSTFTSVQGFLSVLLPARSLMIIPPFANADTAIIAVNASVAIVFFIVLLLSLSQFLV